MRLEQRAPARILLAQDGACEEHADRLAADEAGADHPLPDPQHVAEVEIGLRQLQDPLVLGERHAQQGAKQLPRVHRRLLPTLQHLPDPLGQQERAVPLAEAEAHGVESRPGLLGQDLRDDGAVRDRAEVLALPRVQHVHGRRVAVLHLARLDVDQALVPVHVGHDLRGVRDGPGGLRRVQAAQDRKVRERLHVVDVRAGEHEEVAEHAVARPGLGEVGKAVEDEERAAPRLADRRPHAGDETLEPVGDVQLAHLRAVPSLQQRGVPGEAQVDELAPGLARRIAAGGHQGREVVDVIDLPDQVVAGQQPTKYPVEGGDAGAEGGFDHGRPLGSAEGGGRRATPQGVRSSIGYCECPAARLSFASAADHPRVPRLPRFRGTTGSHRRGP